ncbi:sugar-binding transcriptional regulator [Rhizobium sp. CC-YZS058]|uniref:sugar-binding transcriptional regulator n=1 Tax=Rhizobium sp. CC-YZS058 TaxID=3042153 RepID=UPI002B0542AA|nr:sugar-binding transcriptional regulator [Rhizobium sp. CC-YZS058]MEA3536160.1 sugar-binding transcriptional regulator [Rhizobium sp. CC-YZS058]
MPRDDLGSVSPPIPAEFDDAIVWAAWLYYEDQLTQHEIAKLLGVSRATIVNYLQEARKRGIVRILMNAEVATRTDIARSLAERYGLEQAMVLPAQADDSHAATLQALGAGGARLIERLLKPGDTICVSWGRTVLAVAEALQLPRPLDGLSVVQVTGASAGNRAFSAEFCTAIMARNLSAVSVNMVAPAVLSSPELRDALMGEPVLRRQFARISQANLIVFGVGALGPDSTMRIADVTDNSEIDDYAAEGAVAVLICRFLDREGRQISRAFDRRVIGIELEDLSRLPKRLCVAGGANKTTAIRAVLKGGYATHLVTDMGTATRLLAE